MTSNEEKVQALLDDLTAKRTAASAAVYDSFFKAPQDVREMFYQYWIKHKDMATAPQYLVDYEASRGWD